MVLIPMAAKPVLSQFFNCISMVSIQVKCKRINALILMAVKPVLSQFCNFLSMFSIQVKCKSIDASDVADGIPSVVLGLIWNIIVLFHVKNSVVFFKHILK